jgi:hypothetical protein
MTLTDRGTLFTPEAINNETAVAALILALSPQDPPLDILQNAISMYPADPAAGSYVPSPENQGETDDQAVWHWKRDFRIRASVSRLHTIDLSIDDTGTSKQQLFLVMLNSNLSDDGSSSKPTRTV